jgi:hypothetical protein
MNILQPEAVEMLLHWCIPLSGALSASPDTAYLIDIQAFTGPLVPRGNCQSITTLTRVLHGHILYPIVDTALLHANTYTQQASVIALQSGPDLSSLISDLKAAITLPGWVGRAIWWTGLITLVIGGMAYFISPSINNRRRGFVMVTTGVVLAIIGAAFSLFINLIQYVLSG